MRETRNQRTTPALQAMCELQPSPARTVQIHGFRDVHSEVQVGELLVTQTQLKGAAFAIIPLQQNHPLLGFGRCFRRSCPRNTHGRLHGCNMMCNAKDNYARMPAGPSSSPRFSLQDPHVPPSLRILEPATCSSKAAASWEHELRQSHGHGREFSDMRIWYSYSYTYIYMYIHTHKMYIFMRVNT